MELLLWLWYFDNNFFFKIKSTLFIYKFSWILPIIINLILTLICLYYLHLSDTEKYHCNNSFELWQTFKAYFNCLFSIILIYFIYIIKKYEEKEKKYFENSNKIQPKTKTIINKSYYWIKRKTLISPIGIIILYLSVINVFSSFFLVFIYHFNDNVYCDKLLKNILIYYSIFIIITNCPAILSFLIMFLFKGIFYIKNYFSPNRNVSTVHTDDCRGKNLNDYVQNYSDSIM